MKSLVAYGGWGGSAGFSKLVASPTARKNFVKTVVGHVSKNGLDGIDIDWEYRTLSPVLPAIMEGQQRV